MSIEFINRMTPPVAVMDKGTPEPTTTTPTTTAQQPNTRTEGKEPVPDATNVLQTTPTSVVLTNQTSPPSTVGDKGTPSTTTTTTAQQPTKTHVQGKPATIAAIVCEKRKQVVPSVSVKKKKKTT